MDVHGLMNMDILDMIIQLFKKTHLEYKNENDFDIYMHQPKDGIVYFKILPKGKIEKWYNMSSLIEYYRFDGFFCHKYNDTCESKLLYLYNTNPDNHTCPGWVGSVED